MRDSRIQASLVVPATLLALFWAAAGTQALVRTRLREVLSRPTRPFVINGLDLPLQSLVTPPLQAPSPGTRTLVVVTSDTCPYSHALVGPWTAMLSRVRLATTDRIVLVSLNGPDVPGRLAEATRGQPASTAITTVTALTSFIESTGIASTPMILLLDDTRHVRLTSNVLSGKTEAELVSLLQNHAGER